MTKDSFLWNVYHFIIAPMNIPLSCNITLQDVFLMIRRKKLTIFTDAKDTTTVLELKKMIEGK
jgi:hypothetical protein